MHKKCAKRLHHSILLNFIKRERFCSLNTQVSIGNAKKECYRCGEWSSPGLRVKTFTAHLCPLYTGPLMSWPWATTSLTDHPAKASHQPAPHLHICFNILPHWICMQPAFHLSRHCLVKALICSACFVCVFRVTEGPSVVTPSWAAPGST